MQFQVQHLHSAFCSFAQNGKLKKGMLAKMLPSFGFNEMQQNELLNKVEEEEINYRYFLALFGYYLKPDMQLFVNPYQVEEQIQIKYTKEMIEKIYEEFKTLLNEQNFERLYNFLWNNKRIDLANMVDQTTKQISTFIIVQLPNEILALKILSMLADYRVDFTFKDSLKQTILFYICRDGKLKLLDFVLSTNTVNLNDQDSHGQTPLFYAARENRIEIVQRLVFSGADVNIVDTLQHQTAIFYSAREGHLEICKILVESGCNPCHQDQQKKTALFFAKRFGKKDVVEYLNHFFNRNREDSQHANNESAQGEIPKMLKKKIKDLPKQAYKLLFTDEEGNQQEVTASEFQKFQEIYPDIANLITNADQLIDEDLLNVAQEQQTWQKTAQKILLILWKTKGGQYFWAPVDVKKYGIADYFDVVKNPMDFGTVKKKLSANVYKQCSEYYNDMLLIFDNCILYNGTENEVGQIGATLKQEFENLIQSTKLSKYLE